MRVKLGGRVVRRERGRAVEVEAGRMLALSGREPVGPCAWSTPNWARTCLAVFSLPLFQASRGEGGGGGARIPTSWSWLPAPLQFGPNSMCGGVAKLARGQTSDGDACFDGCWMLASHHIGLGSMDGMASQRLLCRSVSFSPSGPHPRLPLPDRPSRPDNNNNSSSRHPTRHRSPATGSLWPVVAGAGGEPGDAWCAGRGSGDLVDLLRWRHADRAIGLQGLGKSLGSCLLLRPMFLNGPPSRTPRDTRPPTLRFHATRPSQSCCWPKFDAAPRALRSPSPP